MLDISRGITTIVPIPSNKVERAIDAGEEQEALFRWFRPSSC